jgi:hypothetical protein
VNTPDAGPQGGAIGDDCAGASETDPQGNCAIDLLCLPLEYVALSRRGGDPANNATCTKRCTNSNECGASGGVDNICIMVSQTEGFCARGCDGAGCGTGRACVPLQGLGSACIFTCAANAECGYGFTCTDIGNGTKVCDLDACPPNGSCGSGRACHQISSQVSGCVDACPTAACPSSLTCDATSGVCKAPGGTYYTPCTSPANCPADGLCVAFQQGATSGVCMQKCTTTGLCGGEPPNAQCAFEVSFGGTNPPPPESICAIACPAAPATCPTGTVCDQGFCIPPS